MNRTSESPNRWNGIARRNPLERRWWRIPRRYSVALMCYIAFIIREWMIQNISMIFYNIFLMEQVDRKVFYPESSNWSFKEVEAMVYAFYWANAIAQIPSALLTLSFSPHRLMTISMCIGFIIHMMTPWALKNSSTVVIIVVFLQGLFTAILDCSCIGLWREWAPPTEKTSLVVLAFSGQYVRGQILMPIVEYFSNNVGAGSIYYIAGISGIVWCVMWNSLNSESPNTDHFITEEELLYLEETIPSHNKEKLKVRSIPVKGILKSLPVISLCLVFFCATFSSRVMILYFYQLSRYGYDSEWIQWILCLYYAILIPASGFLIDMLINKKKIRTITIRKMLCCGGLVFQAIFMSGTFVSHAATLLICYLVAAIFLPLAEAGALPNILDLSTRYGCIIMGLAMTLCRLAELAFDFIIIEFESDHQESYEWILSFIPSVVLSVAAAIMYGICGSSEEQPWSNSSLPTHQTAGNDARYYPQSNSTEEDILVTENL